MKKKSVKNSSNQVVEMNLKLNQKETSFKDEIYNRELFEENNPLLADIQSFNQTGIRNNEEPIMAILDSNSTTSNEKEDVLNRLQIWLEIFQLEKPVSLFKYLDKFSPYFNRIIIIVRNQILTKAINNPKENQKSTIRDLYNFSNFRAPDFKLPENSKFFMSADLFLSRELTLNLEKDSQNLRYAKVSNKKPLILLNEVKVTSLRNKFYKQKKIYERFLKKGTSALKEEEKEDVENFKNFIENLDGFQQMKVDSKFRNQRLEKELKDALTGWEIFLGKRKDFEEKENRELALKIMMTVLNLFERSGGREYTVTMANLWNKIYLTLIDLWIETFKKEFFEREKTLDKTLTFNAYTNSQQNYQYYRSLRQAIKTKTSVKSDESKEVSEVSPEDLKTIKKEYYRISEPLVSALISSKILIVETPEERKNEEYVEGQFFPQEQLKEQSYNMVKLNMNFPEIGKVLTEYEHILKNLEE